MVGALQQIIQSIKRVRYKTVQGGKKMNWLQNGNLAKLVAFFVIAVVITCTVSFAANGWQSFINNEPDSDKVVTDNNGSDSDNVDENQDGEKNEEDVPVVLPTPKYYHTITGLETDLESSLKRPLCLCIGASDPSYGISSSYLTIEFPTEYGNTRFLCFTDEAKTLGKIGSLSPSRGYISNLATYFGGILLSYGTDDTFDYDYKEPRDKLDFSETNGYCYTEYNSFVYTNGDLVNAFLNNTRINMASSEICTLPYLFPEPDNEIDIQGENASSISIIFSDNNSTQLNYSTLERCYILSKNSIVKNDLLNDKSLKYDNVFILYANSTTHETEDNTQLILDTYTKGSGIYSTNGCYIEITWEKDASGNLVFYDLDGERLNVNRGTSYISFVKSSLKSQVKIS